MVLPTDSILHCLNLDGSPLYDLPAKNVSLHNHYDFFWRAPAVVIYYVENRVVTLPNDEMVSLELKSTTAF
jgi:hypothetical protein